MKTKPVAERFVQNVMLDIPPQTASERVDFGFNNAADETRLLRAYREGLVSGKILPDEINSACGDGPQLTELVQRIDPTLNVETDYDSF